METKQVHLGDYPFLLILTRPGMSWGGASPTQVITVVAVEGGVGDWAAYCQVPWITPEMAASNGDKLPKETAEEIFPEWAKKYKWRY